MDNFNNISVIIVIWYSEGVDRLVQFGSWDSVIYVSSFSIHARLKHIRGISPVKLTGDDKWRKGFFHTTVSSRIAQGIIVLLTSTPSNITPEC